MGSKYPVLSADDIIRVLVKLGSEKVSQKGSHVKYKRYGDITKIVIVPMHNEIAIGTLKSILEQAGIVIDDFNKKL
jgi:predicted RNA binding protein YcfA (HicA-like mRNA interferase family)